MLSNKDKYRVIKARHFNGCSIESLAKEFELEEETVELIVDSRTLLDIEDESADTPPLYEPLGSTCTTCGSPVNGDGVPLNCSGDCQQEDSYYYDSGYPERDGMPEDLNFND